MQRLSKNVEKSIKIVENAGKYQSIDLKVIQESFRLERH